MDNAPSAPALLGPRPLEPLTPAVRPDGARDPRPEPARVRSERVRSAPAGADAGVPATASDVRVDPWPDLPQRVAAPGPPVPGPRLVRDLARAERLSREQAAV